MIIFLLIGFLTSKLCKKHFYSCETGVFFIKISHGAHFLLVILVSFGGMTEMTYINFIIALSSCQRLCSKDASLFHINTKMKTISLSMLDNWQQSAQVSHFFTLVFSGASFTTNMIIASGTYSFLQLFISVGSLDVGWLEKSYIHTRPNQFKHHVPCYMA